jgi:hypothetical protein
MTGRSRRNDRKRGLWIVIACDKREAFAQGANGSRECATDDRLREAIHGTARKSGLLRRFAPRNGEEKLNSRGRFKHYLRIARGPIGCRNWLPRLYGLGEV